MVTQGSLVASTLQVERAKTGGIATGANAKPDLSVVERFNRQNRVDQGLVGRLQVSNARVNALFVGTNLNRRRAESDGRAGRTFPVPLSG
jgi:hypothetical protein